MINLNFIKNIKAKIWLILSLLIIILLLFLISFKEKKPPEKKPSPSLKPTATNLPLFNPQTELIDDPSIGQEIKQIYQQMPWLKKLPLEEKNYVLSYNWEKQAIRARLIINPNSSLPYNSQVSQIKKEVKKKLTEIGVDLKKTKLYYTFIP